MSFGPAPLLVVLGLVGVLLAVARWAGRAQRPDRQGGAGGPEDPPAAP